MEMKRSFRSNGPVGFQCRVLTIQSFVGNLLFVVCPPPPPTPPTGSDQLTPTIMLASMEYMRESLEYGLKTNEFANQSIK